MNRVGDSKEEIETPALLVDLDRMEKNISNMANFLKDKEAKLMAHTKVHRTPIIAHKQIQSGAAGICCQKVSQAEVMASSGLKNILITNQIATPHKIERLLKLAKCANITVEVDDPKNIAQLSKTAHVYLDKGQKLNVIVDVNMGAQRFGVEPGISTLKLIRNIKNHPELNFIGLMGHIGHISKMEPRDKRRMECKRLMKLLIDTKKLIEKAGIPIKEISTGSTGTYDTCSTNPGVTQIQAGSYLLMDADYHDHVPEFDCALTIFSTVISKNPNRIIVTDAGMMSMSSVNGKPRVVGFDDLEVSILHAENISLKMKKSVRLNVGDKIEFIPSYLDATVGRYDRFYGIRKGKIGFIGDILGRDATT